ncbi:MAG: hypothetical protein AAGG75_16285 [Bacteroidota bacterium]
MFGWFHISGHSDTQFKHRKAFASQKAAKPKTLGASEVPDNEEIAALRREGLNARFRKARQSRRFHRWVFFPMLSALFICLFFTMHYTSRDWIAYEEKQRKVRGQPLLDRKKEENIQAYIVLVKTGNRYLLGDHLEEAQAEFTRALRLNAYGVAANLGMSETLAKRCEVEGKWCEMAQHYIEFTAEIAPQYREGLENLSRAFGSDEPQ